MPRVRIHCLYDRSPDPPETPANNGAQAEELPSEKASRLCESLRGLLKEELKEYGGGEAFIRWIRSEDEDLPKIQPV